MNRFCANCRRSLRGLPYIEVPPKPLLLCRTCGRNGTAITDAIKAGHIVTAYDADGTARARIRPGQVPVH